MFFCEIWTKVNEFYKWVKGFNSKLFFFSNSNKSGHLLCFKQSKCLCYDCNFKEIYWYSIYLTQNSQLVIERSTFDQCYSTPIRLENESIAEIISSKISNATCNGICLYEGSKATLQNTTIENCICGIDSYSKSKIKENKTYFTKKKFCQSTLSYRSLGIF